MLRWRITHVEATLVEAGNPSVIVRAKDLGLDDMHSPLPWGDIDDLCQQAADRIGVQLTSVFRVILVGPPCDYTSADGTKVNAGSIDLTARITTDGHRVHHAFTGTGSINLAAASVVTGSVPERICRCSRGRNERLLRLGHPSGVMEVSAEARVVAGAKELNRTDQENEEGCEKPQGWFTETAGFYRTARFLMTGEVVLADQP